MINTEYQSNAATTTHYGFFTDFSKQLNEVLGDNTNRTVSRRTAQGFIALFKLHGFDEDMAEHLVHLLMVMVPTLFNQKSEGAQVGALVLSAFLLICYWSGKSIPKLAQQPAQVVQWNPYLQHYNFY